MSSPEVYVVWFGKRGNRQPFAAFAEHDTARACVAERLGIPIDLVNRSLESKPSTYRIRRMPFVSRPLGWVVCSDDPTVKFRHYLEYCDQFGEASDASNVYPGGRVRRETVAEAMIRVLWQPEHLVSTSDGSTL